jgi:hypothetical protein
VLEHHASRKTFTAEDAEARKGRTANPSAYLCALCGEISDSAVVLVVG